MTRPAEHFSATAVDYAATMAPSLRPIAAEVVRRASLAAGERILDLGTGTGTAAAMARGDGRVVVGLDAAPGMLNLARGAVEDVEFVEADFAALPFGDGTFDVLLAVHALLFADDQLATLVEWLRVAASGARLSLSVPGPVDVTPTAIYREVYERHGIDTATRYPTPESLAALGRGAAWSNVRVDVDPGTAIVLADERAFRTWRRIGMRGPSTEGFTREQHESLTREMLAVTPRDGAGRYRIPFGTIYLTATASAPGETRAVRRT